MALDRVIAVVNDEAITQFDINDSRAKTVRQLNDAKVPVPPADVLDKQVLERLINERALMQFAKESGIKVDDTLVERTIARVVQDNKMTPELFRAALAKEGISYTAYREDIRKELTLQRLRDREVDRNIFVSEPEVDNYLANADAQAGGENEYKISHVIVRVPEEARPEIIEQRRKRAEDALAQIKARHRLRPDRGELFGRRERADGRRPRLAHGGAAAGDLRRGGAQSQEGRRVAGDAQSRGLPHHQARRHAQPQCADRRRADARAAHPGARQRNGVGRRGQGQDRPHSRAHRRRRQVRRPGEGQLR